MTFEGLIMKEFDSSSIKTDWIWSARYSQ